MFLNSTGVYPSFYISSDYLHDCNEVDLYIFVLCLVRESASLLFVAILKADWFSTVRYELYV